MIGRNGERGSGMSALAARHDDDDDDQLQSNPDIRELSGSKNKLIYFYTLT